MLAVEELLRVLCYFFDDELITDLKLTCDFTILADESTDQADRAQLAICVRYIDITTHLPIEKCLGVVTLAESKKAIDIHAMITVLLEKKGIEKSNICFLGLDGTNAMSGKINGLQRLRRYSIYINCRNHCLALCLVHVIPHFGKLFENAQEQHDMAPLEILKVAVTCWLMHGQSCNRIISRFEPLIKALDAIYIDKKEAKGATYELHVTALGRSASSSK